MNIDIIKKRVICWRLILECQLFFSGYYDFASISETDGEK